MAQRSVTGASDDVGVRSKTRRSRAHYITANLHRSGDLGDAGGFAFKLVRSCLSFFDTTSRKMRRLPDEKLHRLSQNPPALREHFVTSARIPSLSFTLHALYSSYSFIPDWIVHHIGPTAVTYDVIHMVPNKPDLRVSRLIHWEPRQGKPINSSLEV